MKRDIQVVAAVIRDRGKVFATQRGYGPHKDGWEFPGGKVEPGETPEQALIREIREELDTVITVGEKIGRVEWEEEDRRYSLTCFLCRVQSGGLTLREHESARWLGKDEADQVDWLPADRRVIEKGGVWE